MRFIRSGAWSRKITRIVADIPCVKLPPFLAERRERGELALHGSFLSNCRETPALTGLPFSGIIPNNVRERRGVTHDDRTI